LLHSAPLNLSDHEGAIDVQRVFAAGHTVFEHCEVVVFVCVVDLVGLVVGPGVDGLVVVNQLLEEEGLGFQTGGGEDGCHPDALLCRQHWLVLHYFILEHLGQVN